MFRGLGRLLIAAADWQPRDFLIGVVAAELVALFAVVSLCFGTFAAYMHLSALDGAVFAALVIAVGYAMIAVIAGAALVRWHARPPRHRSTAQSPPDHLEALLQARAAADVPQDPLALIAALQVGRDLSPMELLAFSLMSGFFAGRKAGK